MTHLWAWLTKNGTAISAAAAIIVSIAALFVAWDQSRVMRAQQHGAAFPVVQVDGFVNSSTEIISIGVRLSNNGVGPALIRDISLTRDGEPQGSLSELLDDLPEGYDLSWSALVGRALAPGEDVTPIRMSWARDRADPDEIRAVAAEWDNWDLAICYCSVFDRCWISSPAGGAAAEPVRRCEGNGPDLFEALGDAPFDEEAPE